jgi:hypothetical protein
MDQSHQGEREGDIPLGPLILGGFRKSGEQSGLALILESEALPIDTNDVE